jgi:hypothetical protein
MGWTSLYLFHFFSQKACFTRVHRVQGAHSIYNDDGDGSLSLQGCPI